MKAKRYNPVAPIRNSLLQAGYSTVKVTNAVNSALGELVAKKEEGKLADSRITKTAWKVRETVSVDYESSTANVPLRFDTWCGQIAKANETASFETVAIPGIFKQWLDKFAKAPAADLEKESAQFANA